MANSRRGKPGEPPAEPPELRALREATQGLEYPSESDAPFDVVMWGAGGPPDAAAQVAARAGKGRRTEEVPVDRFFGALERVDDAERFAALRQLLESSLRGLRIFRVGAGETKVDVYLVGRTRGGEWVALHTTSVET